MKDTGTSYAAPAIDRMLDLVEFLSAQSRPFGVSELSRTLKISSNSVFRIMTRLVERGYAVQDEQTKGYMLTPRLFMLGRFRQDRESLKKTARRHLEQLADVIGETIQIQIPSDSRLEVLDVVAPKSDFYLQVTPGSKVYYHANAYGKAILAMMTDDEIAALLPSELPRLTAGTITTMSDLLKEIATVRKTGIAYDREEYSRGVYCVGAVVLNAAGKPVAGLGITGMRVRFDKYKTHEYEKMVLAAAAAVSNELGYTGDFYTNHLTPDAKSVIKEGKKCSPLISSRYVKKS